MFMRLCNWCVVSNLTVKVRDAETCGLEETHVGGKVTERRAIKVFSDPCGANRSQLPYLPCANEPLQVKTVGSILGIPVFGTNALR